MRSRESFFVFYRWFLCWTIRIGGLSFEAVYLHDKKSSGKPWTSTLWTATSCCFHLSRNGVTRIARMVLLVYSKVYLLQHNKTINKKNEYIFRWRFTEPNQSQELHTTVCFLSIITKPESNSLISSNLLIHLNIYLFFVKESLIEIFFNHEFLRKEICSFCLISFKILS